MTPGEPQQLTTLISFTARTAEERDRVLRSINRQGSYTVTARLGHGYDIQAQLTPLQILIVEAEIAA